MKYHFMSIKKQFYTYRGQASLWMALMVSNITGMFVCVNQGLSRPPPLIICRRKVVKKKPDLGFGFLRRRSPSRHVDIDGSQGPWDLLSQVGSNSHIVYGRFISGQCVHRGTAR